MFGVAQSTAWSFGLVECTRRCRLIRRAEGGALQADEEPDRPTRTGRPGIADAWDARRVRRIHLI